MTSFTTAGELWIDAPSCSTHCRTPVSALYALSEPIWLAA